MITTQTIYFTMVHHPIKGRIRAGNACMTRKARNHLMEQGQ